MDTRRHDAIADDLTGATEVAAIGVRHGLSAAVVRGAVAMPDGPQLVVRDSDTRLDEPEIAAEKVAAIGRVLRDSGRRRIFKKTDSVLRGPVIAELEALADTLGFRRVIFAPANPSLGRTIISGDYFVGGVPLHQTAFANDPHHPRRTARVIDLLGPARAMPVVIARHTDDLPEAGIIVAEASTRDDVRAWARCIDDDTLPAGGADFFNACLGNDNTGQAARAQTLPSSHDLRPALFVMGSVAPASRQLRELARASGVQVLSMPDSVETPALFARWCDAAIAALENASVVMVVAARPPTDDPRRIRETLASLVVQLWRRVAFRHLVVEGGATGAAVLDALGWSQLNLVHEWAQGVASLRPLDAPEVLLTFKPGSYAWPAGIRELITPAIT